MSFMCVPAAGICSQIFKAYNWNNYIFPDIMLLVYDFITGPRSWFNLSFVSMLIIFYF